MKSLKAIKLNLMGSVAIAKLISSYAAMGRDMEMNGGFISIQTAHDEIHIFGAG